MALAHLPHSSHRQPPHLHSLPTRRSSDLTPPTCATPGSPSPRPACSRRPSTGSTRCRWSIGTPRATSTSTCSARSPPPARSEEHTSELQSPCNLVCRLLLEKKKRIIHKPH